MLISKWIKKVIYNWIFCQRYFEFMQSISKCISSTIIVKFSQILYNNWLSMIKLDKLISFEGLLKTLLLNGWDMIFKILFYTRNIQINNCLDIIKIIIASIILILYFIVIFNNSICRNQKVQIYKQKSF
ncbi:unnamed protein product [Paramecium primaurelia]|uniref:Transmembrane protein n=1 Tax=Paramecium primaurelia TaxID=5886 RepID=A0A8S1NSD6_PARPR|nr:unnamed protein product [Paramecium primaurelia]